MARTELDGGITRRRALALGGGAAGALLAARAPLARAARAQAGTLPADRIQQIVQAEGTVTDGVLSIDISRDDIGDTTGPSGVTFTPAFEVDGTLTFQPLSGGRAFFNGDIALKESETNAVIDAILHNGLVFQAFHMHFDHMRDSTGAQVWFIHFRGVDDPIALAHAVHRVLLATSTPLPQTMPSNPTTPLDPDRLASILHGTAEVGDEGVVTVSVNRTDTIRIHGVEVSPEANISTTVAFKPLNSAGTAAAVAPDFSMTGRETLTVIKQMRYQGWHVGCLYNQETQEHPQLFFSHMVKKGDPYALAAQVRSGLDLTNSD